MVSGLLVPRDSFCPSSGVLLFLGPSRGIGTLGGLGLEDAPVEVRGRESPARDVDIFESSLILSLSSLSDLVDVDSLGGGHSWETFDPLEAPSTP